MRGRLRLSELGACLARVKPTVRLHCLDRRAQAADAFADALMGRRGKRETREPMALTINVERAADDEADAHLNRALEQRTVIHTVRKLSPQKEAAARLGPVRAAR